MKQYVKALVGVLIVFALITFSTEKSNAESRVALVIGNANYQENTQLSVLNNPLNDADSIATVLNNLGFDVIKKKDIDFKGMLNALVELREKVDKDGIAIFYYSGHGLQYNGDNYLLSIAETINYPEDLKYSTALNLNRVLEYLKCRNCERTNIVILDACRTNPFRDKHKGEILKGLATPGIIPGGTIIGYATAPNEYALDGPTTSGANSPYTKSLIHHLPQKCQRILDAFMAVAMEVAIETKREQNPWTAFSPINAFDLAGCEKTKEHLPGPRLLLSGSTTIGDKLILDLLRGWILANGGADISRLVPESKDLQEETTLIVGEKPANADIPTMIDVVAKGSSFGFSSLLSGETNIIAMASREIRPEEVRTLSQKGDMKSRTAENVIALDGLAIILNIDNPIKKLSLEQIRQIYSGEIRNWSEIKGGMNAPITKFVRSSLSGTHDFFVHSVMKNSSFSNDTIQVKSANVMSLAVAKNPNGIGYNSLSFVDESNLKAIEISDECGFSYKPTPFSVRTEEYPLTRRLFLYQTPTHASPLTNNFLTFIKTTGQILVEKAKFVDLSSIVEATAEDRNERLQVAGLSVRPTAESISVYQDFIKTIIDANRLSLTFRFKGGSTELDNKALEDIDRLADFMKRNGNQDRELMLLGFTDAQGNYTTNLRLSEQRAQMVENILKKEGVRVDVIRGFGSEAPVCCREDGFNQKNRRVEVWIK